MNSIIGLVRLALGASIMHIAHGMASLASCGEFPGKLNDLVVISIVDACTVYAPYEVAMHA